MIIKNPNTSIIYFYTTVVEIAVIHVDTLSLIFIICSIYNTIPIKINLSCFIQKIVKYKSLYSCPAKLCHFGDRNVDELASYKEPFLYFHLFSR